MKKLFAFVLAAALVLCVGCNRKKTYTAVIAAPEETATPDTTAYGVCGDGTVMHTLQLVTDMGDTIEYALLDADDSESCMAGGLMAGDRVAVTGHDTPDGCVADKVLAAKGRSVDV